MAVHGCPRSNLESTLRCPHGRILALPPADREPSRFAAHGQAQKHLVFAVRPSGPTCCGRGPSAIRGQYRDAPVALLALSRPERVQEWSADSHVRAAEPQPKERGCVRRTSRSGKQRHKGLECNRKLWRLRRAAAGAPHTVALRNIV